MPTEDKEDTDTNTEAFPRETIMQKLSQYILSKAG